ncbi:unnamed protein product [Trifolium pratense]|uniref:Uncharacterized protein n=1 Tax=Trifolium pratense TaxID=57577 RepID=A0ACB0KIM2_TRIPR|nr:unnamed protein product [Trifolium pratense]
MDPIPVENDKDFAKLKDLVGEQDNTDPDPKVVENDKDFARPIKKFKVDKDGLVEEEEEEHNTDSGGGGGEEHQTDSWTRPSDREIFKIWQERWGITYADKKEEDERFLIFQKSLSPPSQQEFLPRVEACADLTQQELEEMFGTNPDDPVYNYLYDIDIKLMCEVMEVLRPLRLHMDPNVL